MQRLRMFLLLAALFLAGGAVLAQSGGSYDVEWQVLGSAGLQSAPEHAPVARVNQPRFHLERHPLVVVRFDGARERQPCAGGHEDARPARRDVERGEDVGDRGCHERVVEDPCERDREDQLKRGSTAHDRSL